MTDIQTLINEADKKLTRLQHYRDWDNASIRRAINVEYTYDSNRIEGNTLTLRETDLVIHKGLTIGGKPLVEHLEAINHYEAVELIRDWVQEKVPFNESALLMLHALILRSIDKHYAGSYRDIPVTISGSRHIPPQPWQVSKLMEDYFLFYSKQRQQIHPIILAAEMHEQLVTIHPLVDGNGRTARLVMNLILMQHGFPLAIFHGDNTARMAYYDALERCNTKQDKTHFHQLVVEQVLAALEQRLKLAEGK